MRLHFLLLSVPVVVTVMGLGLWQGNVGATEVAGSLEIVTSKSVAAVEGNSDFVDQATGINEKALAPQQARREGDSKRKETANNKGLFVMFLQVLRSAK